MTPPWLQRISAARDVAEPLAGRPRSLLFRAFEWTQNIYRMFAGPNASLALLLTAPLRWIYGNRVRVRVNGKPFTVDLRDDGLGFRVLIMRGWEPDETALFRTLIKPGARIIDLGANIGYFSVLFGLLAGEQGVVIGIEPDPENAALARLNVEQAGLGAVVRIVEAAAGAAPGRATLHRLAMGDRSDQRLSAERIERKRDAGERLGVDVDVVTVDDCARGLAHVDLIKMDVQGWERYVLDGMRETLSRNPDLVLVTEISPAHLRAAGTAPEDLLDFLAGLGYSMWLIGRDGALAKASREHVLASAERMDWINVLCSRQLPAQGFPSKAR